MQSSYSRRTEVHVGFWARLAAYVLDSVIVFVGLLVVRIAMSGISFLLEGTILDGEIFFQYTLKDICLYLGKVAYFVGFTYCTGTTLGKKALNLCVISAEGEKLTFLQVIYRETVGRYLSGFVINLGYFMMIVDKEKRTLHDILSDTRVVYREELADSYARQGTNREFDKETRDNSVQVSHKEDTKARAPEETATTVSQTFQQGNYVYRTVPPKETGSSMRREPVRMESAGIESVTNEEMKEKLNQEINE